MKALVILPFLFSPAALAKNTKPISGIESASKKLSSLLSSARCFATADEQIGRWKATREWKVQGTDMDGGKTFASPTDKTGVWVEAIVFPNQTVEVVRVSPDASVSVSWKSEDCSPRTRLSASKPSRGIATLTDADIEKHRKGKGALYYLWSPNMPISYEGFGMAESVARKYGIDFVPLLDPGADPKYSKQAMKEHGLPAKSDVSPNSIELSFRGLYIHYPATIVVMNGKFSGLYPGLPLSEKALDDFVGKFAKGGKQ